MENNTHNPNQNNFGGQESPYASGSQGDVYSEQRPMFEGAKNQTVSPYANGSRPPYGMGYGQQSPYAGTNNQQSPYAGTNNQQSPYAGINSQPSSQSNPVFYSPDSYLYNNKNDEDIYQNRPASNQSGFGQGMGNSNPYIPGNGVGQPNPYIPGNGVGQPNPYIPGNGMGQPDINNKREYPGSSNSSGWAGNKDSSGKYKKGLSGMKLAILIVGIVAGIILIVVALTLSFLNQNLHSSSGGASSVEAVVEQYVSGIEELDKDKILKSFPDNMDHESVAKIDDYIYEYSRDTNIRPYGLNPDDIETSETELSESELKRINEKYKLKVDKAYEVDATIPYTDFREKTDDVFTANATVVVLDGKYYLVSFDIID
ncbi:MAG: hypothetical protein K6E10_02900 [Eubacterium sp.]|nr:hypothetical protein [Eubacterium sp.]